MTKKNVLVIDGDTVKLRIHEERQFTGNHVHVDWVRFTCILRNAPTPDVDLLFPPDQRYLVDTIHPENESSWQRYLRVTKLLSEVPDVDWAPSAQAYTLAVKVATAMGPDFVVDAQPRKGMDFYKFRWSILLNETEVAWVGYLSATDSPSRNRQNSTIHANVMGTACTFAKPGWNTRLADLIDETKGVLTRADLALDFFDGYLGGIESVRADYRDGLCNVGGRKLKFNLVGDWENHHDRSVYLGSREAGKITNVYEKGDQLYGEKTGSDWLRFELRYGNKLRVLSSDVLRRPDAHFGGASDWHASVLLKAGSICAPEKIARTARLPLETVQAECVKNVRWLATTAASSMALFLKLTDGDTLWELAGNAKLPGRLRKFSMSQIAECFTSAVEKITTAGQLPTVPMAA